MSNTGHGHVRPRPDGAKARCGGPGICAECSRERKSTIHPMQQVESPPVALDSPCSMCGSSPSIYPYCARSACPCRPGAGAPQHWIQTLPAVGAKQGGCLDLVNPTPAMIDFRVMATVLARVPRFGGHTGGGVVSVAQHCTEGARAIWRDTGRRDWAAAFLLHDGHEAYMGDIATPVARALAAHAVRVHDSDYDGAVVKHAIASLKSTLDVAIYQAAGIEWPLPLECAAVVKVYDIRMGRTERDARLATPPHEWETVWEIAEPVADVETYPWSEGFAAAFWWTMATELLPCLARSTNC